MLLYYSCVAVGLQAHISISYAVGSQDVTIFCHFPTTSTATATETSNPGAATVVVTNVALQLHPQPVPPEYHCPPEYHRQ
jgi:hypothetical protein